VPPYDYSWGPFTEIQSLCEGDYGITVTDTYGCTAGQQYTIDQPTELVYDTAYQHVDCYGSYTGMAEIIPSGGVQPYTYTWSNSANTGQLDGIPAGDYDVTVTDANGCTVSEGFTITEPDELLVSFNDDIAICQGQEINLIATPIGGTAPYTIFWNDGSGYSTGPTGPTGPTASLSDDSVTYAKIASDLKSKSTISSSEIDWSDSGVFTKTLSANTTFTFSNLQLNKVITLVLTGDYTITWPSYMDDDHFIGGDDYDGTVTNYIQIHCTNATSSSEEVWWTVKAVGS